MAGTVTTTEETFGSVKKITFDWLSSAGGAADATTTKLYNGIIERVVTITRPLILAAKLAAMGTKFSVETFKNMKGFAIENFGDIFEGKDEGEETAEVSGFEDPESVSEPAEVAAEVNVPANDGTVLSFEEALAGNRLHDYVAQKG